MDGFEIEKEHDYVRDIRLSRAFNVTVNASGPSIDSCSHFLSLDISVPFDAHAIIRLIDIGITSDKSLRFFN